MSLLPIEQERLVKVIEARARRRFAQFNENVKPRVCFAELISNLSRGYTHHPYAAYLEEVAERNKVPYDPNRPFIEFKDLTAAVDMPVISAAEVVDPADMLRPFSVTGQLGIKIETGLVGDTVVPWTSATSPPYWLATEATNVTESQPTLSAKTLKPKTVGVFWEFSRNFAKQANAETFVQRELLGTVGTAVDQVVLAGATANNQPDGLLNASGLQTITGTALTGASANAMLQLSADEDANDDTISYLGTPTVRRILQGREKAAGNGFVWDNNQVAGRPARVTTDLPVGALVCGPWPMIYLGIWGAGFVLEINPYHSTGFKAGIIQARMIVSCDVAVRSANAFVWAISVT